MGKVFNSSLKLKFYTYVDFFAISQKEWSVFSAFCFASSCKEANTVFWCSIFLFYTFFASFFQKSIWHFGDDWLTFQYFSLRELKPVTFLVNFFIPLRRAEAITWGKFVPSVQKRGSALPGSNFLHVIAWYNLFRIYFHACMEAENGTGFQSDQPWSCNHHL